MALRADTIQQTYTSHRHCFACGSENEDGLGLVFCPASDGSVKGECVIDGRYQGYPGVVQGGIVATILDCAMTNCLFASGIEAMTARMSIQFRCPVMTGLRLNVEGVLVRSRGRVYELEARILQSGAVCASASARFVVINNAV